MTPHDIDALRRGGWVVINRDGSTYNNEQIEAAIALAAVGLALWFRWSDAHRRARVIDMPRQLELFNMTQERIAS